MERKLKKHVPSDFFHAA